MINFSYTSKTHTSTCLFPVFSDGKNIKNIVKDFEITSEAFISDFKGETTITIYHNEKRLIFIGLNASTKKRIVGELGETLANVCKMLSIESCDINTNYLNNPTHNIDTLLMQFIVGLSVYNTQQKTKQKQKSATLIKNVYFQHKDNLSSTLENMQCLVLGIDRSITLANMPPNQCNPQSFIEITEKNLEKHSLIEIQILDKNELKKQKLNALLAVGMSANVPPYLMSMHYKHPDAPNQQPIAIIGKGVTFDSGGLSLKPANKMDEMKFDMCGAATTVALMDTIAQANLPLNVVGVVGVAENAVSQNSARPSDVVVSHSGKTIEILNTDAEGRLILCDAISWTKQTFKPQQIIDIATLTGAVIVGLGNHYTGVLGNNQTLIDTIINTSLHTWDYAWQLPIDEIFRTHIDSEIADIANINTQSPGSAGTITAACFLEEFVGDTPWIHLDIAGVAWKNKKSTVRPLVLLYQYLNHLAQTPQS